MKEYLDRMIYLLKTRENDHEFRMLSRELEVLGCDVMTQRVLLKAMWEEYNNGK